MTLTADIHTRVDDFVLRTTFSVARGRVLALVGPNGAGKTTCLRTLAGLQALDAGLIDCDTTVYDDGHRSLAPFARSVGYLPAGGVLFPHLDALDNVALPLRARGRRRAPARVAAQELLTAAGAASLARRDAGELSAGETQRVALARALAGDPALVLLDEPFAAIAAADRPALRAWVRNTARAGFVVVATHDPDDVAWADDVLELRP